MNTKIVPRLPLKRRQRGRPPKFGRPARPVTLTLPEDVITALATIDDDLSRAVVRLAQPLLSKTAPRPAAELAKYGDRAVIVIEPVAALEQMKGVKLVHMPDGRALISLADYVSVYEFELRLRDILEERSALDARGRSILLSIGEILRGARLTRGITLHQPSIIVLQSPAHQRLL
jgi:hypothetical protein